jgi:glycosyltransferase involved in cell wall biosynthesis
MRIVWLSWKDLSHPEGGGAEVVTHEILRRAAAEGHEVVLLTSRPAGAAAEETRSGYRIVRAGNRWSVYVRAWRVFAARFARWAELVVEECNTVPFFSRFYARQERRMFFHQLCREVWFYQLPPPFSLVGYLLEPLYLRALSAERVVTVSESTRADLLRAGFSRERVGIISEGITLTPVADPAAVAKFDVPTVLCLGSLRAMKRTLHVIEAFERAKAHVPALRLIVAGGGSGPYAKRVRRAMLESRYAREIEYRGAVDDAAKLELMQRAHVLAVASVKEGWGLVVTEANSQGTPAAAYDVDGLRDSVRHGETGLLASPPTPSQLAARIVEMLSAPESYERMRREAWAWSRTITFDRAYDDWKRLCLSPP